MSKHDRRQHLITAMPDLFVLYEKRAAKFDVSGYVYTFAALTIRDLLKVPVDLTGGSNPHKI